MTRPFYPTYATLKAVAKASGRRVTDLLALAPKNDPFYVGSPAQVERGRWFTDAYAAAGYSQDRPPHLRRVHYWTVSQPRPLIMPDGKPYENTQACWEFMGEASKAARYLGMVAVDGITDNKNPAPALHALYTDDPAPSYEISTPDLSAPAIWIAGPSEASAQPYHLEIWCEKSTMNDVLLPICRRYHANLVTFEGEVSITAVCVSFMRRLQHADKPARVFYISDFDPAGNSMPVAMSRKLEWAIYETGITHSVKVRPLALTRDQVATYRLPRIPIKDTERRAAAFETAFGSGAVELDALEALYPGALASMVSDALEPYYSAEAERARRQQLSRLENAIRGQVEAITERYQDQIAALQAMQDELRAIDVDPAPYAIETAPPTVAEQDDWLFSSTRDYFDQIDRYKAHKNGDAA